MLKNKLLVALAILALTALGSCGASHVGVNAPPLSNRATSAFQVNVMPETYNLGGSTHGVFATVDQSPRLDQGRVVVNINVDRAQDLKSLYITLRYDPQQYRAIVAQPTKLMGDPDNLLSLYMLAARGTVEYGQVLVHPDSQPGLTGSGVVAQVSFSQEPELAGRAVSNAGPPMSTESQITNLAFDGTNLTWAYFQQGDYDQNGETNVADLTPIGQNFKATNPNGVGHPYPFTSALSQIDGDSNGEININDITPIGQNYKHDTLGGFHVFKSGSASDYPTGNPPIGVNGAGTTELTIAPAAPVAVTAAVNYAASNTERITFMFTVPAPAANDLYWIRPADGENVLGIASNTAGGNPTTLPALSLDPATPTPPSGGDGSLATPYILADTVNYNFKLLATPGGADVTTDPATVFMVTPAAAGSFTGNVLDVTTGYSGDYTVTATYGGVQNSSSSNVYCRSGAWPPPTVSSTSPANADDQVALNIRLTATFSQVMNPATISATTFTLHQGMNSVSGSIIYTGVTAMLWPDVALAPNTVYTATITTGAENLAGVALADDYVWTFETGATPDTTSPTVSSTVPANGAAGVAINIKPSATFSEAMDPQTISLTTFTVKQGATPVSGNVSYAGVTATFSPVGNLAPNTVYTATITAGSEDLAGNALSSNYVWTFETGATTDTTPPTVSSTVPDDGDTNVALNIKLTATFSEAMDPPTISTTTFTLRLGTIPVSGNVTYAGVTAAFAPVGNLAPNTLYTATITTGSEDLVGNALVSNYLWTFETGATTDTTPPTVSSTVPDDGDTNVSIGVIPAATFDEAMDVLTITNQTFILMQGLTPISGTVDYVGLVATFTPDDSLEVNTEYTATITTGAEDLAGNALASNYDWAFTTAVVGLGGAETFGSFGGGAGMTNQGIFTVVDGDIGTTGASTLITGFHDSGGNIFTETPLNIGLVTGIIYTAPPAPGNAEKFAIASQAAIDAQIAYDNLSPASLPGGIDPGAGELGGLTLAPGVYMAAGGSFQITGLNLTLDAQGDENAVWVFQAASSLTVGDTAPRSVILINGALAQNVYWYVGSAATINGAGGGTMVGTIIAYAGVTFSTAGNVALTVLDGRAIGLSASVTLVNTIINTPE